MEFGGTTDGLSSQTLSVIIARAANMTGLYLFCSTTENTADTVLPLLTTHCKKLNFLALVNCVGLNPHNLDSFFSVLPVEIMYIPSNCITRDEKATILQKHEKCHVATLYDSFDLSRLW